MEGAPAAGQADDCTGTVTNFQHETGIQQSSAGLKAPVPEESQDFSGTSAQFAVFCSFLPSVPDKTAISSGTAMDAENDRWCRPSGDAAGYLKRVRQRVGTSATLTISMPDVLPEPPLNFASSLETHSKANAIE